MTLQDYLNSEVETLRAFARFQHALAPNLNLDHDTWHDVFYIWSAQLAPLNGTNPEATNVFPKKLP